MKLNNLTAYIENEGDSDNDFVIDVGFKPVNPFDTPAGAVFGLNAPGSPNDGDSTWLALGK